MKRTIILAMALLMLLCGCGKGAKNSEKNKDVKSENIVTQKQKDSKSEKKSEVKENPPKNASEEQKKPITDKDGNSVTGQDLQKLVEKANDPNIDEKTKREILDQIDYILKQAEH